MSTQQYSPKASQDGDNSASDLTGDGQRQAVEGAADGEQNPPLATTAELANLLANGQWGDGTHDSSMSFADAHAYDGHVALALDTGVLPDIDSTLDLLTSSHHLFDVPALDVSPGSDDSCST